jgi:hypothetical protein
MFKRSITADLYAPKSIPEQVDFNPLSFQREWQKLILDNWHKYQVPILAGVFLAILCVVFALDHFRTIATDELSVVIQRQQLQIQSLQLSLQSPSKTPIQPSNEQNESSHDDERHTLDIKYWGMMRVGSSTKALIEINQSQKLVKVGEEVDEGWLLKGFDQEFISLESKQGRLIKISMEMPS